MQNLNKMYMLRTPLSNKTRGRYLGHTKNDRSYVFAFQHLEHAILANKNVSMMSNFDVIPRKIINEVCLSVDLKIYTEPINTFKTNLFEVQQKDIVDLLTLPLVNNIGLVIATDILSDPNPEDACDPCDLALVFESVLISPFDMFRSN